MQALRLPPALDRALAWVYPNVCQLCSLRQASAVEGYVCGHCRRQVRFIELPFCRRCGLPFAGTITGTFECANCRDLDLQFDSARSAVLAHGVVLEVIHRYKYQRALWFEPFLADLLLHKAAGELPPAAWDVLVPVPLYPAKERHREFNQAERLARLLGEAVRLPVQTGWVRRVRPTHSQTQLTREGRANNMHKAFAPCPRARVAGLRCVLVDDVFTTGATASACAAALKQAGARAVCVWTVARGL